MAHPVAIKYIEAGSEAWNEWRKTNPHPSELSLDAADLKGRDLSGFDFTDGRFDNALLTDCRLRGATLKGANFTHAHVERADLTGANLQGAQCPSANFTSAKLGQANLKGASLQDAILIDAQLGGVDVDNGTHFTNANVTRCHIERYVLERIPAYGQLTPGQRMTMDIVDPVATLRSYYSGFWLWIHLAALLLFVTPYFVFLAQQYVVARFSSADDSSITLLQALGYYIWTGGTGTKFAPWPFAVFCFSVVYNALRAALLFKTKQLELKQVSSGLPALFSLSDGCGRILTWLTRGTLMWGTLVGVAKWMFYFNVLLVLYHTYHFLQMRVAPPWP